MPITLVIFLAFIVAIAGAIVALVTQHKRAGLIMMIVGLLAAGGLSLSLLLALQNM